MVDASSDGIPLEKRVRGRVDLKPSDLQALARLSLTRETMRPQAVVIGPDQKTARAVFVVSGWAIRAIELGDGRRQILSFVLPGDAVGLDALILGHSGTVVTAITPLTVAPIGWAALEQTLQAHPELRRALLWTVAEEYALLGDRLASVGRRPAFERLARLLLELTVRARLVLPEAGLPVLPLTQTMLADAAGLSDVHVNRTLRKLRAAKLVAARRLAIEDLDGLIAAAQVQPGDALDRLVAGGRARV